MKSAWAVVKMSLWQRRWSIFWWSVAVVAFIGFNLAFYPSFEDQAAELDQALASMPDALRALFTDNGDFVSPVGFLSSQIYYLLLPLMLGVFAIGLGSSLLAREEQAGTMELLLARPISRTKLLLGKLLAGGLALSFVAFVALVSAALGVRLVGLEVSGQAVVLATIQALLLAALFGMVAFTLSAIGRWGRAASLGIAATLALGGYIVASLEKTATWLAAPAKILPYHYYHPSEVLSGASRAGWEMVGFVVVILALIVVSVIAFRRRDLG